VSATDLVTILFTDWVDSTATRTRLGEERADRLQHVHDGLLRETIVRHDGTVVKGSGDGIVATFHSATNAIAAAVDVQQRFDGYSRTPAAIAPVSVRIGISVGDIVHQDGDIFGTPVVEAARLEASAAPGQILCSEMVRMLARGRGDYEFDLIGLLELKGLPEPLAACAVRWVRAATAGASSFPLPHELAPSGGLTFIGRDDELQRAVNLATAAEQPHALWLLGEPGIGKTRLATEIVARAHAAGALVLFGRCDEHVAAPFQPVIQALRWHVQHLEDERLADELGVDADALARLAPELRSRLPGLGASEARATETEQYRLFEAVASWLVTSSRSRPVVMVVDDAHWCDRPTLALLGHVLRLATPARLLLIGTARDTAPDASDPLTDLIDDLEPTGRSRRVALRGLSTAEVATLVQSVATDRADDTRLADRIAQETAGNPLFVGAVLAGLTGGGGGELPVDVTSAVRRRVRGLPSDAQEVIRVASVVGLEFALSVATDAAGVPEAEVLTAVEHAMRAGLVHEVSVDRFQFTHALVRDALEGELTASRLTRLHAAIAASIEARFAQSVDDHLRALAHHYARAGNDPEMIERAFDAAVRSARRALELLAFDAGVEDYSTALELLARLPDRPAHDRFELLVATGEAQRLAAAHGAALATLSTAAALAREEEDWESLARAAIAFEEASWRPGLQNLEAVQLLEEATVHASALPERQAVVVQASFGRALHYVGQTEEPRRITEEALAAARRVGDPALLAHALLTSIQIRVPMIGPDYAVVVDRTEELWALHDQLIDPDPVAHATEYSVAVCLDLGDRERADDLLSRLINLSDRLGMRFIRYVLLSQLEVVAFIDGDLERAEREADATLEFGRQLGEDVSGVHGIQMFLIRREQDRLAELVPVVQMLLRLNPATAMWRPGLVLLLAESGLRDEARGFLDELATDGFAAIPHDNLLPTALCFLVEAAARLDAVKHAPELAELLEPWAGYGISGGHMVAYLGATDRYLGLLAALEGRLDEADTRLKSALAFNRGVGAKVWEAHTLADLARVALARGDVAIAGEHAAAARIVAGQHGLLAVLRDLGDIAS
jgi:class 3 adenylate cyclase/tetratricopeptide (TPR) repeat protein